MENSITLSGINCTVENKLPGLLNINSVEKFPGYMLRKVAGSRNVSLLPVAIFSFEMKSK